MDWILATEGDILFQCGIVRGGGGGGGGIQQSSGHQEKGILHGKPCFWSAGMLSKAKC